MTADKKEFYVVIERDEDDYYVGEMPQLKACYSQGETINELMANYERSNQTLYRKSRINSGRIYRAFVEHYLQHHTMLTNFCQNSF